MLNSIKNKIFTPDKLVELRNIWGNEGEKVVFTNGCFDLIHLGHLDYLARASELGDKFIIAVNADSSVKLLKGPTRPFKDEYSRMLLLASLTYTDAVVLFHEETPFNLISKLIPDVLVKGGDYHAGDIIGGDIIRSHGGQVVVLPFLEGYSTTGLVEKINGE